MPIEHPENNLSDALPAESAVFYGIRVNVQSHHSFVLANVRHDFHYFMVGPSAAPADLTIRTFPADRKPEGWKKIYGRSRSYVCRGSGDERRVVFFGNAWTIFRFDRGECEIYSDDPEAAYEVCYLAVLSYVGERLDRMGLHRLHGLAVTIGDQGFVLMGPSGTGKSTLATRILSHGDVGILSDDTPIVTRDARMHAFPLRIAVLERPDVPDAFLRRFRRFNIAEKYVIRSDFFQSQMRKSAPVKWLLRLRRNGEGESVIKKRSRWGMIVPLIRWLIVGKETQQAWEFFIRLEPRGLPNLLGILARRAAAAVALFQTCSYGDFYLSKDIDQCVEVLRRFAGS